MVRLVAIALVACSAPAKSTPLENHGRDRPVACDGLLHGRVTDPAGREPLPGATIVLTGPTIPNAQTAITDENGLFAITAMPGNILLTVYYAQFTVETRVQIANGACPPNVPIRIRAR